MALAAGDAPDLDRNLIDYLSHIIEFTDVSYWNRIFLPVYLKFKELVLKEDLEWTPSEGLKQRYIQHLAIQVRQQHWLKQCIKLLIQHQIPAILLKNAANTGFLYSMPASRLSQDLDILVHPTDYLKTIQCLEVLAASKFEVPGAFALAFRNHEVQIPIATPIRFSIEVHRHMVPKNIFRIDEDRIWSHSVVHPLWENQLVRMLSPEDWILHSAIHGFMHVEFEPHNLLDVYKLTKVCKLNWSQIVDRAEKWRCESILLMLVNLLGRFWDYSIEQEFSRRSNRRYQRWSQKIREPSRPFYRDPNLCEQLGGLLMHDSELQLSKFFCFHSIRKMVLGGLRLTKYLNERVTR